MIRPSIQDMVFRRTIPHPKQNDPNSFFAHVQRNLVPEVRLEVQTFYGSLDCIEAQYPGLDYTFAPHRRRLSRYPWHRRLFRTFDELRLTEGEILSLCQWEGTRSAKERYEAETKRTIKDTTAEEVVSAPRGHGPRARIYWSENADSMYGVDSAMRLDLSNVDVVAVHYDDEEDLNSCLDQQLNQQLQSTAAARSTAEESDVDAQWEQWMKEALERNELDRDSLLAAIREGYNFSLESTHPTSFSPPSTDAQRSVRETSSTNMSQPQITQRYHDLRAMLQDLQSANNQLSAENAALAMFLSRSQPEMTR